MACATQRRALKSAEAAVKKAVTALFNYLASPVGKHTKDPLNSPVGKRLTKAIGDANTARDKAWLRLIRCMILDVASKLRI